MEPTQEQIKRFWEWCGFTEILGKERWRYEEFKTTNGWWEAPTGERYLKLPSIDLNNLFEWAVPQLPHLEIETWLGGIPFSTRVRIDMGKGYGCWEVSTDPALALFWVINKIREVEGGK